MTQEPLTPTMAPGSTYARFSRRLRAALIDAALFALVFYIGAVVIDSMAFSDANRRLFLLSLAVLILAYDPVLVAFFGATIGHRLTNLRVVDDGHGGNISLLRAIARALIKDVLGWLSFAAMAITRRHQAIHDVFTNSTVQARDLSKAQLHHFVPERIIEPLPDHLAPERIIEPLPGAPSRTRRVFTVDASGRPHVQCAFTGAAGDYFRIWIVNLLLTLVTVGLWSPWAKVRKRRYFYGHTWLADANFEYHGNPVAILRGRLIAAAAIAVYWVFRNLVPTVGPWLLAVLLCGAPWIIARSLTFNAANSSHRGIRFRFSGTSRDVALAIWPLALSLVAYVATSGYTLDVTEHPARFFGQLGAVSAAFFAIYPYAIAQIRRLTVGKSAWGDQAFSTTMRTRNVYSIYLTGVAVCCIPLFGAIIIGFFMGIGLAALGKGHNAAPSFVVFGVVLAAFLWASLFIVWTAYNRSRMTNLVLNTARLSDLAKLHCAISAITLGKLYAVNVIAIVGSCGLLIPWAVVRVTRYRLQAISVEIEAPLTTVTAMVTQNPRATGEELSEMFGIDLAL